MPRYVAFLRGVSPLNAKMPDLKRCFEGAGFSNVRTVLGSGNVVFDTTLRSEAAIERHAEKAMTEALDRTFYTIARSIPSLEALLAADPFSRRGVPADAKLVVSFLRETRTPKVKLPLTADNATVLYQTDREVFTAYMPTDKGPVFMKLIQNAFGTDVTTRTWETIKKCAAA